MKATVLLVEDERDTREMLASALERAGYRCIPAADAREAIAAAAAVEFVDVVVTDIVLGRDDRAGLRLMAELRAAGVTAPVVVITAFADVDKVKTALNQRATHLLEKPFRARELVEVVERARADSADPGHAVERFLRRANLTAKELTVARHLLGGLTSNEIADFEGNSPKTIRQHVSQIYAKCGVEGRAALFRLVYTR